MADTYWLWVITFFILLIGSYGISTAIRYYEFKKLGNATGNQAAEVYWTEGKYWDVNQNGGDGGWYAPNAYDSTWKSGFLGSGYADLTVAYGGPYGLDSSTSPETVVAPSLGSGPGLLAIYDEINQALQDGMNCNRWGFFDGSVAPGGTNARGAYGLNPCGGTGSTATSSTCAGQTPSGTSVTFKAGTPQNWWPSQNGVFVALPISDTDKHQVTNTGIAPMYGGPFGTNGDNQPKKDGASVNAYCYSTSGDLPTTTSGAWGTAATAEKYSPPWDPFIATNTSSDPNITAGFFVYGVKPPPGTAGILPFDVVKGTWNDPKALPSTPGTFNPLPTTWIIFGAIFLIFILGIFFMHWFKGTKLGHTFFYWI
jgi:hypothetical protein